MSASTTAGSQFAIADPDVAASTVGALVALACPRAKNAVERSSTTTWTFRSGRRNAASAKGVERAPGKMTARWTPAPGSPSIRRVAHGNLISACVSRRELTVMSIATPPAWPSISVVFQPARRPEPNPP